jgi:hypothetical protein
MKGIAPLLIVIVLGLATASVGSYYLLNDPTPVTFSQPIIKPLGTWWFPATPNFVINETSHFDLGISSDSNGNYETETFTDNLAVTQNTLQLQNLYSDRFTFNDTNGNMVMR